MEDDILAVGWVVRADDGRGVRAAETGIGLFAVYAVYAVYEGIQVYGLLATTGRDVNKRRGVVRSGEQTGGMLNNTLHENLPPYRYLYVPTERQLYCTTIERINE